MPFVGPIVVSRADTAHSLLSPGSLNSSPALSDLPVRPGKVWVKVAGSFTRVRLSVARNRNRIGVPVTIGAQTRGSRVHAVSGSSAFLYSTTTNPSGRYARALEYWSS